MILLSTIACLLVQGFVFSQGEGGVFTPERLAALKTGEGALGNNPQMMNLYSDMRMKLARMGEEVKLGLDDIEGTIYLDENFRVGTLYYEGVAFKQVQIRYDAYNDEIEILDSESKEDITALVKYTKLSAALNGDTFLFKKYLNIDNKETDGYLMVMYSGEVYQLYQGREIVFKEGKPAKTSLGTSFPHRFIAIDTYYLSTSGELPKPVKLRKSVLLKAFGEAHEKEIKEFINNKGIDINDKKGLVNLLAFANSLEH